METFAHSKHTRKALERVLKKSFRGGRLAPAAFMDALFSCLILVSAVYVTIRPHYKNLSAALLTAGSVTASAVLVLLVIRRERYYRHVERERNKARIQLIDMKMLGSPEKLFDDLDLRENEFLFRGTDALTADDIRELISEHGMPLRVVTLAEPTEKAGRLIECRSEEIDIVPAQERSKSGLEHLYPVTEREIDEHIVRNRMRSKRKTSLPSELFRLTRERAFKYLAVGAGLFVFSFFARYTLYFRLVSSICLSIGAGAFAFDTFKRSGAR